MLARPADAAAAVLVKPRNLNLWIGVLIPREKHFRRLVAQKKMQVTQAILNPNCSMRPSNVTGA